MAVVKSTCGGVNVCYTGVADDGEQRECARCMQPVRIDPAENNVEHIGD